jgi:hypothetical protein
VFIEVTTYNCNRKLIDGVKKYSPPSILTKPEKDNGLSLPVTPH